MTLKYLITGATGGLGKEALNYFIENISPSEFAAASSRASNRSLFEDRGIAFRHLDYDDPESLDTALQGVEHLLLVSLSSSDRVAQHSRVIDAAKKAKVGHIWYTSLAFGGLRNDAVSPVQVGHIETERLLKESGVTYTAIREGIYTEAFPVFLGWRPDSTKLTLPGDGEVAFTLRPELGEASARIMTRGGYENQTVLFTAEETITAKEIVRIINDTTGRNLELELVDPADFVASSPDPETSQHRRMLAPIWDDIVNGRLSTTDPLMHEVLGREPTKPRDALRSLLERNRDFTFP